VTESESVEQVEECRSSGPTGELEREVVVAEQVVVNSCNSDPVGLARVDLGKLDPGLDLVDRNCRVPVVVAVAGAGETVSVSVVVAGEGFVAASVAAETLEISSAQSRSEVWGTCRPMHILAMRKNRRTALGPPSHQDRDRWTAAGAADGAADGTADDCMGAVGHADLYAVACAMQWPAGPFAADSCFVGAAAVAVAVAAYDAKSDNPLQICTIQPGSEYIQFVAHHLLLRMQPLPLLLVVSWQ
jgi:hypothetical protein